MKRSTGRKIVILADILFGLCIFCLVVGTIGLAIGMITLLTDGENTALIVGLIYLLIALGLYTSGVLLTGYGEMVENSNLIRIDTELLLEKLYEAYDEKNTPESVICEACKAAQNGSNKFCCNCGIALEPRD